MDAAGTKWNFLKFRPGLVGGHCISVDPYFLIHKAIALGYSPEVILAGRNVNDRMPKFIALKVIQLLKKKGFSVRKAKVLILGITYKEDCNDIRNSKIPEIFKVLEDHGCKVDIFDPIANADEVKKRYGLKLKEKPVKYEAIILAVSHEVFISEGLNKYKSSLDSIIYDVKSVLSKEEIDDRL